MKFSSFGRKKKNVFAVHNSNAIHDFDRAVNCKLQTVLNIIFCIVYSDADVSPST